MIVYFNIDNILIHAHQISSFMCTYDLSHHLSRDPPYMVMKRRATNKKKGKNTIEGLHLSSIANKPNQSSLHVIVILLVFTQFNPEKSCAATLVS